MGFKEAEAPDIVPTVQITVEPTVIFRPDGQNSKLTVKPPSNFKVLAGIRPFSQN
ncbi:hypothetical protein J42TS3_03720 [Paenibacillus vini]|uniref:Uncharacterized protein n=1 Tax=Paenibacillus vini TaxID=1476024 RepID=A0ABQ4M5V1_9BACL|nr:hypothetical protein J42TS3_03720 [Paenibacillus vini]